MQSRNDHDRPDQAKPDLSVRKHQRLDVALDAELSIAQSSAQAVRFSNSLGGPRGPVGAVIVDASPGGLGFMTTTFFPRLSYIDVAVRNPMNPSGPALLRASVRVQRITMTDRRPGYLLGTSIVDTGIEEAAAVANFIAMLEADDAGRAPHDASAQNSARPARA